jgi:CAAX prenyl protease-like protein
LIAADFEEVPLGRFSWFSFAASSVAFGALHGHWLAGTLAGMGFALVLYYRGRLCDCIVAHATANALLAAYVLSSGAWSVWS